MPSWYIYSEAMVPRKKRERLDSERERLLAAFESVGRRALRLEEVRQVRRTVVPTIGEGAFLEYLLEEGVLQRVDLESKLYPSFRRYLLKGATPFEVALSLRDSSYLSHASAVFLHGLTEQLPLRIFANREQSAKPEPAGELRQEALTRAFSRPGRETNYILSGPGYEVVLLSGKFTKNLEVGTMRGVQGESLVVTKLERTLIDIAVRPTYAGGIYQVFEAYRSAKERVSIGVLLSTLKKLDYLYPYHQAIGFYMERAGYPEQYLRRVEELGMELDFYLAHGLPNRSYSKRWRLNHPDMF
jgi:predicted transcriptional regulator of viral defense system